MTPETPRSPRPASAAVVFGGESEAIARGQGVSLWRQIASRIEQEIGAGRGADPVARLPTEAALAARFAVNRHTVRRAMEDLEARGLIRVEQGRGSFVSEDVLDYPLGPRTRFSENVRQQNREPAGQLLRTVEIPADTQVAEALGIARGQPVILAERLSLADGRPVVLGAHHFSARRFPGMREQLAANPSITAALSHFGVPDYRRRITRVTARMPTAEEARLLQQSRARPVLVTEAVNVDSAGLPVELSIARYASARMQLVIES